MNWHKLVSLLVNCAFLSCPWCSLILIGYNIPGKKLLRHAIFLRSNILSSKGEFLFEFWSTCGLRAKWWLLNQSKSVPLRLWHASLERKVIFKHPTRNCRGRRLRFEGVESHLGQRSSSLITKAVSYFLRNVATIVKNSFTFRRWRNCKLVQLKCWK